MTGDKPDERLRTPMHWTHGHASGFTDGTPWEPLQPDSLTANVEAQARDSTSLLNLYRRLIHLRAANPALAEGALYPLKAPRDSVIAYLRSSAGQTVLVVANLGSSTVTETEFTAMDAEQPKANMPLRALPSLRPLRSAFQPRRDALTGRPAQLHVEQSENGTTRLRFRGELPPVSAAVFELVPER